MYVSKDPPQKLKVLWKLEPIWWISSLVPPRSISRPRRAPMQQSPVLREDVQRSIWEGVTKTAYFPEDEPYLFDVLLTGYTMTQSDFWPSESWWSSPVSKRIFSGHGMPSASISSLKSYACLICKTGSWMFWSSSSRSIRLRSTWRTF